MSSGPGARPYAVHVAWGEVGTIPPEALPAPGKHAAKSLQSHLPFMGKDVQGDST